jgi:hypothetical protein
LPFSHLPPGFGKEEKEKEIHTIRETKKKTSEEDTREIEHVHKNNKVCFSAYTFFFLCTIVLKRSVKTLALFKGVQV